MSNSSFLGYGLSIAAGIVAGFIAPGIGFSWLWAFSGFALASTLLVRPPLPSLNSKPPDFGNSGRQANTRQAAAEQLNLNSASEAIAIPVAFGTVRINGNHIGFENSTFRSVPIISRNQRDPQRVAFDLARETFETTPSVVDHEIDNAARKSGGGGGKKGGGGKGGRTKNPPPSRAYSDSEKIAAYTQVLLEDDESGARKLPKEYDEVTVGFKYYLSFEIGVTMGPVAALHGVLSYPGENYVIDRRATPYIVADDTVMVAAGTAEGGNVRFYRGSGTQERNVADPYAAPENNYKGVAFAVFEDYYMGNAPQPNSFSFELERIPVCLDENGDPIPDFELRAGDDTEPTDATEVLWQANVIIFTAPGHEITTGATFFATGFEPAGYNGVFVCTGVTGDDVSADLLVEPPVATTFGEAQGPPTGSPVAITNETWDEGTAEFTLAGHGFVVGQLVEITDYTSDDWNGTRRVSFIDGNKFSVGLNLNPGAATGPGKVRPYPLPSQITAVNWEAGVATFEASNEFDDGDAIIITGMSPAVYNGQFTIIDGDGSGFDVALNSPPAPADVMGTVTGPPVGASRDIQEVVSWVANVVTFDMDGSADVTYEVGDVVRVTGCTPTEYNADITVTKINGDQWSGTLELDEDPGDLTVVGSAQKLAAAQPIQSAGWLAGQATYFVPGHSYYIGAIVTIAGMEPDGYNGTFTIDDIDGPDQFGFAMVNDPGRALELGTIRLRPDAGYGDANPAAVLFELFTDKTWGRGLDPRRIDFPSFVRASQYFKEEGIGMSFTLESQGSLSDVVEQLRACVNLAIIWVGDKLYAQCLNDRTTAYAERVVITRDMINGPDFSRKAWPNSYNEVRVQFQNRANNFQAELAAAHDDANYQIVGQVNSTKVDLPAISSREVATLIAQRVLFDLSYPQATLSFRMNRFHSGLIPTRFVEFRWPDWSTGTVTTYWRVVELSDNDQNSDGIQVTLAEDLYSTPVAGVSEAFEVPVPAFEGMTRADDNDLFLAEDKTAPSDLTGVFLQIAELPISLTDADRTFAVMAQRKDGFTDNLTYLWKEAGDGGDYALIGNVRPWAIAGVLMDALPGEDTPGTGQTIFRDHPFTVQLRYATERAKFLEYCSTMPTSEDGFEVVRGSQKNWLVIDNEFIEVAQAEAGPGSNTVIVTGFVRACYGSEMAAHSVGTSTMFAYDFIPYAHTLSYNQIPVGIPLTIKVIPEDRFGRMGEPYNFAHTFTGLAQMALRIQYARGIVDGDTWEIEYRPRWHNRGAEFTSNLQSDINTLAGAIPTGYETWVMPVNTEGAELLALPVKVTHEFGPSDGDDSLTTGFVAFNYDPPATTVALIIYQVYQGVLGLPYRLQLIDDIEGPDPDVPFHSLDAVDYGDTLSAAQEFPGLRLVDDGVHPDLVPLRANSGIYGGGRQPSYPSLYQEYTEGAYVGTTVVNQWSATYTQAFGDAYYVFNNWGSNAGTIYTQDQSNVTGLSVTAGSYNATATSSGAGPLSSYDGIASGSPTGITRTATANDGGSPGNYYTVVTTLTGTPYTWANYMTDRTATPLSDPTLAESATIVSGVAKATFSVTVLPDTRVHRMGFIATVGGDAGDREIRWRALQVSASNWPTSGSVTAAGSWHNEVFSTGTKTVFFDLEDELAWLYTDTEAHFGASTYAGIEVELIA